MSEVAPQFIRVVVVEQVALMGKGTEEDWDAFITRLNKYLAELQVDVDYESHWVDWKTGQSGAISGEAMVIIYHKKRYAFAPETNSPAASDLMPRPSRAITL